MATIETSKLSVIENNISYLRSLIEELWIRFAYKEANLFSNSGTNEDKFSEFIEKYLGADIEVEGDYSNFDKYINPYGDDGVFNWNQLGIIDWNGQKHINPAFFITKDTNAKYNSFNLPSDKEGYFIGTIIVYMNTTGEDIEIYYIDTDKLKSDLVLKFRLK